MTDPDRTTGDEVSRGLVERDDADGHVATGPPLRLLVVDDHEVVRAGLVALLERHGQIQVVAQAGTVAEAVSQARRYVPDLVLMDVRLPDGSGIEACRDIRAEFPTMPFVFLTSSPDDEYVFAAIIAGASGYVLKQSRSARLVEVLDGRQAR